MAHAQMVLSWQETLTKEEMPPEWMWSLDDHLEEWFEGVARQREERFGIKSDREEPPEMIRNEYARMKRAS